MVDKTYVLNRAWVIARDQRLCRYCGCRTTGDYGPDALTVDHVTPRSKGGVSRESNLVVACRSCNKRKADKTLGEAGMSLLPVGTLIVYPRNRKRAEDACDAENALVSASPNAPATTEPAVLEHDGLGQATTNRKEA